MIWVIGGTSSAFDLVKELSVNNYQLIVTTVTQYGSEKIDDHSSIVKIVKPLNKSAMEDLIREHSVKVIIDASHPYVVEVSTNVLAVAAKLSIPCLRIERKIINYPFVKKFLDYFGIVSYLTKREGNILLTIGSKNLFRFELIERVRLFVRVLPVADSLEFCHQNKILTSNIIAMQLNYSQKFNAALLQELKIKYLVTKESGAAGGYPEKVKAARSVGVEVLVLERPQIDYPELVYSIKDVLLFIQKYNS